MVFMGAMDIDDITAMLDDAANDESVKNIVMCFYSPGGETTGIDVLGRRIREIDTTIKPVFAWTENNPGAGSAAYWLASQCRKIGMTTSSNAGSIGCFALVLNELKKMELDGITIEPFVAGKFKAIGHSWHKLTDEEKQILTKDVEKQNEQFHNVVSETRPDISKDDMQGLAYEGQEALDKHYCDMLCETLDEFLNVINKDNDSMKKATKVQVKTEANADEGFAKALKAATESVKPEATKAEIAKVETAAEVAVKSEEEEEETIPGLPGVAEEEESAMCPHCKGTGKAKSEVEEEVEEEDEEEAVALTKMDDDSAPAKTDEEDVMEMSVADFHAALGVAPIKRSAEALAFHALVQAEVAKHNKR
jgi:ClpP class serine protease